MPPRSTKPGFKRGRHQLPYWIARQVVREPMGFPDPCIALPADVDDDALAELCQQHTARLFAWIETQKAEGGNEPGVPRHDGSVYSACEVYQKHPRSRFHKVKRNTRKSYVDSLKIIEATVGKRLIRRLTVLDVEHWYEEWRKPVVSIDAAGGQVVGPERIDRAHNAVAMFRTVLYFLAALRNADCKQLAGELEKMKFERGGAREEEMTFAHASAFVRTALEQGRKGIIPAERALAMAIGTAAQFELLLRQKDIIGDWHRTPIEAQPAIAKGAAAITLAREDGRERPNAGEEVWTGWFTWERLQGWRWRTKTSKSKYRAAADFDLQNHSLLFPLLEAVPHAERHGAIVKGEHGLPVRERSYRKWWRPIARAAGIPDAVWNMDTRAGGATEAEESGVALDSIQAAMTHSDRNTTLRYLRRSSTKITAVAEARSKKRAADETGGGA